MAMAATGRRREFAFDRYAIETLMGDLVGHDRRPSAYLVYLMIAAKNADGVKGLSHAELAEATGLSRRAVQDALAHLSRRRLVEIRRFSPTETALLTALAPWKRR
jgi:transcription initiation factor IIE alpha subunit